MKTTYFVCYNGAWDATVEVDDSAEGVMREMLLFWSGGQALIDEHEGDITRAFLQLLVLSMLPLSMHYLEPWRVLQEGEGWYPLDGSYGIEVLSCGEWTFDDAEIDVQVISTAGEGRSA
jgi:hypothetical protein